MDVSNQGGARDLVPLFHCCVSGYLVRPVEALATRTWLTRQLLMPSSPSDPDDHDVELRINDDDNHNCALFILRPAYGHTPSPSETGTCLDLHFPHGQRLDSSYMLILAFCIILLRHCHMPPQLTGTHSILAMNSVAGEIACAPAGHHFPRAGYKRASERVTVACSRP